ncbi:MAG: zinc ribbon domain-containing protein [Ignavibacteriales bacterium]|nr:zinc ribbon domain-containing protein [Ignavibacteriales bacterium]
MPIYDYRCNTCGKTYDVYHKVREVLSDVSCPSCNSPEHTRLMSVPAPAMAMSGSSPSSLPSSSCDTGGCCGGSCGIQ